MNTVSKLINDGALVTAGTLEDFNTMTIGWGLIGTIWGKKVFMCFVRPTRHTYKYMEDNDVFTINFFYPAYKKEMSFLGTKSGRDLDKVKEVGFTPIQVGQGVSFKESYQTLVCKKIYIQDMDINQFTEDVKKIYYASEDVHRLYIGEIVEEYEN